jgi:hypothetical protein
MHGELIQNTQSSAAGATEQDMAVRARLPYTAPAVRHLGDIRELTLGGSPGIGDSGAAGSQKCPGCP